MLIHGAYSKTWLINNPSIQISRIGIRTHNLYDMGLLSKPPEQGIQTCVFIHDYTKLQCPSQICVTTKSIIGSDIKYESNFHFHVETIFRKRRIEEDNFSTLFSLSLVLSSRQTDYLRYSKLVKYVSCIQLVDNSINQKQFVFINRFRSCRPFFPSSANLRPFRSH